MKINKLLLLFGICLVACGRKSDPEAPEVYAPRAVIGVNIQCVDNGVYLSGGASLSQRNIELPRVEKFIVRRRIVVNNVDESIEKIATLSADILPSNMNNPNSKYEFSDKNVAKGNSYKYYISGIDTQGMDGAIDVVYKVNYLDGSCIVEPLNSAKEGNRNF